MEVKYELDYSKQENDGGPVSIQSLDIYDENGDNVNDNYDIDWVYGYEFIDEATLKKDLEKHLKITIINIESA